MRKANIVVYTAITGDYDNLLDPEFIAPGVDHICFTDKKNCNSNVWEYRKIKNEKISYTQLDPVRLARRFKILAHELFPEYEYSIWMDANLLLKGDVRELIREGLKKCDFATWQMPERIICTYKQAEALKKGDYDDPKIIDHQMRRYRLMGFPTNNADLDDKGVMSCVLVRRHNSKKLMLAMDDWWSEVAMYSKRDQLSFHFIAWKNDLEYYLYDGDARNNGYFKWRRHDSKVADLVFIGRELILIIEQQLRGRNLYVWGTGSAALQTIQAMPDLKIKGFIDSDPSKEGQIFNGKYIIGPDQTEKFWESIYIVIASSYFYEIEKELTEKRMRLPSIDFSRGISDKLIGLVNLKE